MMDSGSEWCQLVDVQIFDSFYQLLVDSFAKPTKSKPANQNHQTKPTRTKLIKPAKPKITKLNFELMIELKHSKSTRTQPPLTMLQMLLIFRLACVSLLTLTGASVGILGEKDYIPHRGRQVCQSVIFSRYCQGVLVPGTVCQVTGNYLIFQHSVVVYFNFKLRIKVNISS